MLHVILFSCVKKTQQQVAYNIRDGQENRKGKTVKKGVEWNVDERLSSPFRNVYAHVLYSCHFPPPIYNHLEIDAHILHHEGGMYTLEQLYYDCAIRAHAS